MQTVFEARARYRKIVRTALLVLFVLGAQGQTPGAVSSFDVASIKPGDPSDDRMSIGMHSGGTLIATNVPARFLIRWAYRVQDFQVAGGPSWIDSDRFVIEAKLSAAPGKTMQDMTSSEMQSMDEQTHLRTQRLLAERFNLQVHHELKKNSVYELVAAERGPKLVSGTGGTSPRRVDMRRGYLKGTMASMGLFAQILSRQIDVVVIDKTGLSGAYDFELTWEPDALLTQTTSDVSLPSLFTAIREQLGLQLKAAKEPVDVLVVDHIEKPSAN